MINCVFVQSIHIISEFDGFVNEHDSGIRTLSFQHYVLSLKHHTKTIPNNINQLLEASVECVYAF